MTTMTERYLRAEKLLVPAVEGKVKNATPLIKWLDDEHFWYLRQTAVGSEYVIVDARTGAKSPAFDHEQLAQALTSAGTATEWSKLGLEALQIENGRLSFTKDGRCFSYDDATAVVEDLGDAQPAHHGPSISPDGNWRLSQHNGDLFLAEGENEFAQITTDGSPDDGYAIYHGNWKAGHIVRGRNEANGRPAGIVWSPNSRHAIVFRIDQRHVAPYPLLETAPRDGSFRPKIHLPRIPLTGEEPPRISWYVLDAAARSLVPIQLPEDQFDLHQDWTAMRKWQWAPDQTHVWAVMFGDNQKAAFLLDIELATGDSRIVIQESDEPRVELNTTSYSDVAVQVIGDLEQVIWYSHRSGFGHLYRYDGQTGEVLNAITQGDWLVRDLIYVDERAGTVVFTGSGRESGNPYLRSVYQVNLDGTHLRRLTLDMTDADVNPGLSTVSRAEDFTQSISPGGRYLVYTHSTVMRLPETAILQVADGVKIATIETADASDLEDTGYRPPEEFIALAADGKTELFGLLYKPQDFNETQRYPVLVCQYASPVMAACPRTYLGAVSGPPGSMVAPGAATAMGMAVIALDARGTTSRSREFALAGQNKLHLIGLDDYAAAIEQLGKQHVWLDTSRVGIQGGSYGGFAAIRAMIEFPETFTAGISLVPMVDVHSLYPDYHWLGWHGKQEYADGSGLRPEPTAKPMNYANMEAISQVDRIKNPLLVVAGELDENCLLGGIAQFFSAAMAVDAPVDLIVVPDRSHGEVGRSRWVLHKCMDHFCRHLMQTEPPRDFRISTVSSDAPALDRHTVW